MNLKELREKLAALYKEGKILVERSKAGTLDEAGETRLAAINDEATDLRAQLEAAEAREARNTSILDGDQHFNKPAGTRASGAQAKQTQHERERADEREAMRPVSLGRRFLESEQFEQYRAGRRSGPSDKVDVRSFWPHADDEVIHRDGMGAEELRTLVYTGAQPSRLIAPMRIPGIFTPDRPELNIRSAFLSGQTDSNAIEFYRELTNTNNAAWVAEATATTGSTGLKPESGFTFELSSTTVKTEAHWIPVTNAMLDDFAQIRSIIESRLIDGLMDIENRDLLKGDGTGANLKGLMSYSGLQALDTTYFSAHPVKDAGSDNENFNRILRGRRLVREVGRARASFVFLHPADSEKFLTSTDGNQQYLAGGPFTAGTGVPRLWGLPVIEDENVTEGEAVVGDGRMAQVFDRMQATIAIGWINDQFVRNMQTILAEERIALAVYREAAFAVVTLAA